MAEYIYGIDLGTTYSCIAFQNENGNSEICENLEGNSTTPSVVRLPLEEEDDVVVGQTAKDSAVIYPENTISFVKNKIGQVKEFAYGPDGNQETTTPIEVSSEILKGICKDAEYWTSSKVNNVVITCPAYFGDAERTATRQAGELAGLNVLALIEEPTAAAIYYGCTKDTNPQNIIVYDLGGGTFDITVMKISPEEIEVITTDGDHNLGGKDWDTELVNYLKTEFESQTGFTGEYDPISEQALMSEAEKAKIKLTKMKSVDIALSIEDRRVVIKVTRETFDEITSSLLQGTIMTLENVIKKCEEKYGISKNDYSKILLVGGSTNMPQVREALENIGIPINSFEPNYAVAKGAAIYGTMLFKSGQVPVRVKLGNKEVEVTNNDVNNSSSGTFTITSQLPPTLNGNKETVKKIISKTTKSFGVKVIVQEDGNLKINNIIMKDSKLPAELSQVYGTVESDQNNVLIEVYQSVYEKEYYEVDEDLKLGEAILELPKKLPANSPIEVTIRIELDGTVTVIGKDLTFNREIKAKFKSECVFTEEELEEIKKKNTSSSLSI